MSVLIIQEAIYLKIANTLNLSYDFINSLYKANQSAYDITYNEINNIDDLASIETIKNIKDYYINDLDILILKTRSIRYNVFTNGGYTVLDNKTLDKLDKLILFLEVKKQAELNHKKLSEVKN